MKKNLFNKVWDLHKVTTLDTGQDQLFIGLHLIHEVTSPQAFAMLKEKNLKVLFPDLTYATVDHIVPTHSHKRPFDDNLAEEMMQSLEKNTGKYGITLFNLDTDYQGIVHTIGPELGLTRPGMTIACGDSHTSTHGAFGAIAFGIGTSQIRDVLATQTLALIRPKVKKIEVSGNLGKGLYAKDIILKIIADLGVNGGIGFAYEYAGETIKGFSMEERLTICNMSIEGGARAGYINPDQTTFDYIKNRKYAPKAEDYDKTLEFWKSISNDPDAEYDDQYDLNVDNLSPMITWGITPGQGIEITEKIPKLTDIKDEYRQSAELALSHMGFKEDEEMLGKKIDVAFIGSCTNGRISDLREVAKIVKGKQKNPSVKALIVPGSMQVAKQAESEGLPDIFKAAGFEWRGAGCSMCLAMNPDKLQGNQLCASSSNRNFIGRQGSPRGRTLLMSPAMAAASALNGKITDVREVL